MVVTQMLRLTPTSAGEDSSLFQFKCYWYSPISHHFEFAWINGAMLKLIEHRDDFVDTILEPGTQALFASTHLELSKRKSTLSIDSAHADQESMHITALLAFVPPVIMANGSPKIKKPQPSKKEKEKIEKADEEKIDHDLIKVKWMNSKLNKFSEEIIPRVCLNLLKPTDPVLLQQINEVIDKKQFIKTSLRGSITYIQPVSISYLSGKYFLRAIDFLSNGIWSDIDVNELNIMGIVDSPILEKST